MNEMELMRCPGCGKYLGCDCREKAAEAKRAAVVAWLRDGIEKDRAAMGRAGSRGDYKTAVAYMEAMERDRLIADAIESRQHLSGDREG